MPILIAGGVEDFACLADAGGVQPVAQPSLVAAALVQVLPHDPAAQNQIIPQTGWFARLPQIPGRCRAGFAFGQKADLPVCLKGKRSTR